jgi:hypothetical protein
MVPTVENPVQNDLVILQGNDEKKADGAHVWAQGVAAKEGHRNVSKRWYDQTFSYDDGLEFLENERRERHDFDFQREDLEFRVEDGSFIVDIDGQGYKPTEHACKQLTKWLGMPETAFFYFLNSETVENKEVLCNALNVAKKACGGEDGDEKTLKFRTYTDGTLRAVLSQQYSIVDNRWYIETLRELIPGGRMSHFKFSDADTIYGNILIPDNIRSEPDSDYGGMISIGNSEIGLRRIEQTPSIFRAICMNGCIWGQTEGVTYGKRHRGIVLEDLKRKIAENIHKQIPLLTSGIDKLIGTRSLAVESMMHNLFAAIIKEHNWDKDVANDAASEWEAQGKDRTAFGVIDAMTRAGQSHEPKLWLATDEIAGKIMEGGAKEWSRLNAVAKSLTTKQVATHLGVKVNA